VRPIERLWRLGLLTPALNAVHMAHATTQDVDLARRTGIAVSLSSSSSIRRERQLPPAAAWAASGIRLGLGSGGGACPNPDLWGEIKLLALMLSGLHRSGETDPAAWDALAAATRGGAAVLGLEREVGTLEPGKWADICCVDLSGPATQPLLDPVAQLVFAGGRDIVSDVWVAGRQLLGGGELTRLDWPAVAAHAAAWALRMKSGG
jgi:5-methylthioadenosine/S-adenosylhomocysteine deaminase